MSLKNKYQTVTGYFQQDDVNTDISTFSFADANFGLITRPYDTDEPDDTRADWARFESYLHNLRQNAPIGTTYKLIFLGRHGQGEHNVAEAHYGRKAWWDHYSKLPEYLDARLTPLGRTQAQSAHAAFKKQITTAAMPSPERYYSSPLTRCLETCRLTFTDLDRSPARPFRPLIKELLREEHGEHTCDKRRTKTEIQAEYPPPTWVFEDCFSETDEVYRQEVRESTEQIRVRAARVLEDIFLRDDSAVLSISTHSGFIKALLHGLGHIWGGEEWIHGAPAYIPTGSVLPVFVKATRVEE